MPRMVPLLAALAACTLLATPAGAATFSNTGTISIPAGGGPDNHTGAATPYPSSIGVTTLFGPITDVNVNIGDGVFNFNGLTHTNPDDIDMALYGPRDIGVVLMSDACGGTDFSVFDYVFDQSAPAMSSMDTDGPCSSQLTRPVNFADDADTWPPGLPAPSGTDLNVFNGLNPADSSWRLYIRDDGDDPAAPDGNWGELAGGWSLTITAGAFVYAIPAGPAQPYPATYVEPDAGTKVIQAANVTVQGLFHDRPDDLDMVLEGPKGHRIMLMSDACGSSQLQGVEYTFIDAGSAPSDGTGCQTGPGFVTIKPTDYEPGESLPPPAPAAPYRTDFFNLVGTRPGGTWKLWIRDDQAGSGGYTSAAFTMGIGVRDPISTHFDAADVGADEGGVARLTIERTPVGAVVPGPATVHLTTAPGTASASDYDGAERIVRIARNETSTIVDIPIVADGLGEGAETFTATLSEPNDDAAIDAPSTATVTIAPSAGPPADGTSPTDGTTPPGDTPPGDGGGLLPPTTTIGTLPLQNFTPFRMRSARRCVRRGRRVRFTPTKPAGVDYVRTELVVNGRSRLTRTGAQADDPISLRIRRRRTRVMLQVSTADGRTFIQRRTYRRCRRARPAPR